MRGGPYNPSEVVDGTLCTGVIAQSCSVTLHPATEKELTDVGRERKTERFHMCCRSQRGVIGYGSPALVQAMPDRRHESAYPQGRWPACG